MARRPRWNLPGLTQLVGVRGNNGQPVFLDDADRLRWLDLARQEAKRLSVRVHAFSLLEDQAYWLVTPDEAGAVSQWMQSLGRHYVRVFNQRHQRTGTLWEGRYQTGVIQPERHLLDAMVYLDWLPVWKGLVAQPSDWPWSSHRCAAGLETSKWLQFHPLLWGLGDTPFAREAAYAKRVAAGLSHDKRRDLADVARFGWALGDRDFLTQLEQRAQRPVQRRPAGRPSKSASGVPGG